MTKHFYWQNWQQPYKLIFWVLFAVLIVFAGTVLVIQVLGPEYLIKWHVLSQQSSFPVDLNIFSKGPFSFSISGYKTIINEVFSGGDMPSTGWIQNLLIIIIGMAIALYLSLVTMFKRFWYLVAMGGLLGFLILFHIEAVEIFGWNDIKTLMLVFAVLLPPSYYLHAFKSDSEFGLRTGVMSGAVLVLIILVYFFSEVSEPFITLLSYGILAPYLLILLFIAAVSHEIVAAFVNVISGTKGIADSTKLRHFIIITVIYLVNILLSYLKIAHYIDWELFYINPYFLLIISAILGVWGSYIRASLYEGASDKKIIWPILYMIIAVVSMVTLSFFMISFNDPFIKVIGDIIIYAHLVIGVTFLLYVIYNFIPLIEKGYEIKKILYNPTNFPYFTYKLLSTIGIIALFAVSGFDYPVWYSMGGYNNVKADLALKNNYFEVAEAYYTNADAFAYHNSKSNYTLGRMYLDKDLLKATEFFIKPLDQRPTPQTVVNAASLKNAQQDYYSGLFTLQKGYVKLGNDEHILNNLAVQFEKLKLIDSAAYYYDLGGSKNAQIRNNRLAFNAKHGNYLKDDSLQIIKNLDDVGKANAASMGFVKEIPTIENADHMYDMVLLNNWLLSEYPQVTDSSIYLARQIIDSTSNNDHREHLLYSWSLAAYQVRNINIAIQGLLSLTNSTNWSVLAKQALVKMYLQLGSYEQAIDVLNELNQGQITLDLAVALLENGTADDSKMYWLLASSSEDEFLSVTAEEILATVFSENPILDTDRKLYLYARYNRYYLDESEENVMLSKINDDQLRISLALDLASFYHQQDNLLGSKQMLINIEGMKLDIDQYREYLLLNTIINNEDSLVQKQLTEFDSLFSFRENEYLMEYTLNHRAGMSLDSVEYLQMAKDNPFFPEAVLIGVSFFDSDEDPFMSYQLLAEAVQINPGSPKLLKAYILKALDVGLDQFAENALYEFSQRFSGQSYLLIKDAYEKKIVEINKLSELELID
jgi:hypothetical protein